MKTIIFAIIMAMVCTLTAMAQESITKQINKIKRDNRYIYAESTKASEGEALGEAKEMLSFYIDEYVASKKKLNEANNIIVKDLQSKIDCLQMKRGTMIRAFVYVKKTDIIPAENATVAEVPKEPDMETPAGETPSDGIVADIPNWQQELIQELMEKRSLIDAKAHLNRLKAEYKIKHHGSAANAKNIERLYWVVESDGCLTVLGPGSDKRVNYRTMQYDNLSNYSGKNAIWFEMAN